MTAPGAGVRPIRFGGVFHGPAGDRTGMTAEEELLDAAREAERIGYSTFGLSDHVGNPFGVLTALTAVAAATSSIRLTQGVLNQDLRHPAVLAKEVATLDRLSGGRVELGIGAGWMRAEYEQVGIRYEQASVRIERLEEQVAVLKGLFGDGPLDFEGKHFRITDLVGVPRPAQPGGPPIKIGGGGKKILSMAARHADIVEIMGGALGSGGGMKVDLSSSSAEAYEERISWVREAAGARFNAIELSLALGAFGITDDAERAAHDYIEQLKVSIAQYGGTVDDAGMTAARFLAGPTVALGTADEIAAKLRKVRDELGVSYFMAPSVGTPLPALAPIIERVAGT